MLNNIFSILLIILVGAGILAASPNALAQEYKLLAPLPGGSAAVPVEEGFSTYASQLFWFLLSAAIILALIMLVVGGVEYIASAGNVSVLGDAKGRIVNALLGLVLVLAAWLILNLINPDLVDFEIVVPRIDAEATSAQKTPSEIAEKEFFDLIDKLEKQRLDTEALGRNTDAIKDRIADLEEKFKDIANKKGSAPPLNEANQPPPPAEKPTSGSGEHPQIIEIPPQT